MVKISSIHLSVHSPPEMDTRVRWADLLPELLSQIADCLEDRADICKFRAVCRSWRISYCVPPNLISLHHPPIIPSIKAPRNSEPNPPELAIFSCDIYLLVPYQDQTSTTHPVPWLLRLQELNPGKYKLRSALTSHLLPKPNNIDPSGFRVIQLAKTYHLTRRRLYYDSNQKVVLLSIPKSNDIAALVRSGTSSVYCVRSREEVWEPIVFEGASSIDDIVLHKRVVYAVDRRGCLYRISETLLIEIVSVPLPSDHSYLEMRKRLVELNGELYLIRVMNNKVHVYKLNERRRGWFVIDSFGDRILFVGFDCCFFASAQFFPRWKGNGIVFNFEAFRWNTGCFFHDLSWEDPVYKYLTCKKVYYTNLEDKKLETMPLNENILLCPPVSQSTS